jgi:hypothetical protein
MWYKTYANKLTTQSVILWARPNLGQNQHHQITNQLTHPLINFRTQVNGRACPFHASRNAGARHAAHEEREDGGRGSSQEWRHSETLGGVAEDAAAEAAGDARRHARAAHNPCPVGVHAVASPRGGPLGRHGSAGGPVCRRRGRGLLGFCFRLLRPCHSGEVSVFFWCFGFFLRLSSEYSCSFGPSALFYQTLAFSSHFSLFYLR